MGRLRWMAASGLSFLRTTEVASVSENPTVGRPPKVRNDQPLEVRPHAGASRLQSRSSRRDVINVMLQVGAPMTINDLNAHFDTCVRSTVLALLRSGWLAMVEEKTS